MWSIAAPIQSFLSSDLTFCTSELKSHSSLDMFTECKTDEKSKNLSTVRKTNECLSVWDSIMRASCFHVHVNGQPSEPFQWTAEPEVAVGGKH